MTAAFEISPDDPQQVAEAIARAAEGAVVHLVRDGRVVADIVPATGQPRRALRDPRHIQISQMMADRFGAPTLADYRRAYDSSGTPWPNATKLRSRPGKTGLVLPLNRSVRASRFRVR